MEHTTNALVNLSRNYSEGMGQAVADRTINRKIRKKLIRPRIEKIVLNKNSNKSLKDLVDQFAEDNGFIFSHFNITDENHKNYFISMYVTEEIRNELWSDVAYRVAIGNTSLHLNDAVSEFEKLHFHLRQASILMSGRHLQHGDEIQASRNMEVFTNCSTSSLSFIEFYLLLNGSGVGRSYDDQLMLVDYQFMPLIIPVIEGNHPDVLSGEISERLDRRSAIHLYKNKKIEIYEVVDSREGWAKCIEKIELMTFLKEFTDTILLIDFSQIRERGAPIHGMQNRPASGPGPLISALEKISKIKFSGMSKFRATMFIDHYLAECVLVGGARRAARMATKSWKDKTIFEFIDLKRGGFLWSSNNSVTVDEEFWSYIRNKKDKSEMALHANLVFEAITKAAYYDGTGEPGLINQDKLHENNEGLNQVLDGNFAESKKYKLDLETLQLTKEIAGVVSGLKYKHITNPCGEITLNMLGGYCVIADVVPYHVNFDQSFDQVDREATDAFKVATRALMRVNLMDSLYHREVRRTNRIGVGITGLHEWAFKRFGYGFYDLIDENKSRDFWLQLASFKRAVVEEAEIYSKILNVNIPHTNTTIKPAGTTSKLFGLTEGAHLPSMREYLRWVQFRSDDPIVQNYKTRGYPVKELKTYSGTTIVGFPTRPEICKIGMGEKLVTASEVHPIDQYKYLSLLEKYWIIGVEENGITPLRDSGNQISYTLKYNPNEIGFEEFQQTLIEGQSKIKCCSVMPMSDTSAYEYQPEEKMTISRYHQIINEINNYELKSMNEDVSFEHVDCASGACPVDFN